jgi:alpha-N-arabinofuranosidase
MAGSGTEDSSVSMRHHLSPRPVLCRVVPDKTVRMVPRTLFGTNLEWFNQANGISAADGSVDPGWLRIAREQGISHVRFPGGTLSDFYHWREGIGPHDRRPVSKHPTDIGRSRHVFGTPELIRFCRAIHAQPLITVNAGTSDAGEAADWVAYCNQPGHPQRTADGLAEPANVRLWEVGNELYLPGNPTDKKIITIPPEVYAQRFLAFAAAMRHVDPSIKVMAIGTANSTVIELPYPNWSEIVLQKAAKEMDYFAVHNAYFPMVIGQPDHLIKDVYQSLWASPEAVDRSLRALEELITRYEKNRRIEIAVTEWGVFFSFDARWIDHVKTMGSAVYLARLMQVFMSHPRVTLANYFKFTDRTFMGWVGYDQRPKIPYYVIELFSQHFGNRLVEATVESPIYSSKSIGAASAETDVPEITVVAAADDEQRKLFINFVNRSWDTIHQVSLDTATFEASDSATAWILSSPGLLDHNGRDLPEEFPAHMYQEPLLHPQNQSPIRIQRKSFDPHATVFLPPYSVVTLELDARPVDYPLLRD